MAQPSGATGKVFTPGVPLPDDHWYRARLKSAINAFVAERKIRHPGVREICAELAKRNVIASEDKVGRYLKQVTFATDLIEPVSRVLGIPPPVIVTASEEHARALDEVPPMGASPEAVIEYYMRGLESLRNRIAAHDQTPPIASSHGDSERVERRQQRR